MLPSRETNQYSFLRHSCPWYNTQLWHHLAWMSQAESLLALASNSSHYLGEPAIHVVPVCSDQCMGRSQPCLCFLAVHGLCLESCSEQLSWLMQQPTRIKWQPAGAALQVFNSTLASSVSVLRSAANGSPGYNSSGRGWQQARACSLSAAQVTGMSHVHGHLTCICGPLTVVNAVVRHDTLYDAFSI